MVFRNFIQCQSKRTAGSKSLSTLMCPLRFHKSLLMANPSPYLLFLFRAHGSNGLRSCLVLGCDPLAGVFDRDLNMRCGFFNIQIMIELS